MITDYLYEIDTFLYKIFCNYNRMYRHSQLKKFSEEFRINNHIEVGIFIFPNVLSDNFKDLAIAFCKRVNAEAVPFLTEMEIKTNENFFVIFIPQEEPKAQVHDFSEASYKICHELVHYIDIKSNKLFYENVKDSILDPQGYYNSEHEIKADYFTGLYVFLDMVRNRPVAWPNFWEKLNEHEFIQEFWDNCIDPGKKEYYTDANIHMMNERIKEIRKTYLCNNKNKKDNEIEGLEFYGLRELSVKYS